MITAHEALGIGLISKLVGLNTKSDVVVMRSCSEEAKEGTRKFSTHSHE